MRELMSRQCVEGVCDLGSYNSNKIVIMALFATEIPSYYNELLAKTPRTRVFPTP